MEQFRKYINQIVNELDCTEIEKEELKVEFLDHLNLLKEEYISKGRTEQESIELAITDFGKEKIIGDELNKSVSIASRVFKKVSKITWWIYILIVVWRLLINSRRLVLDRGHRFFNIVPFKQIGEYILRYNRYNFDIWFLNLFGNMIIFIPFGFLLPLIHSKGKDIKSNIFFTLIFSFCIEGIQYILAIGVFDIDDIILNLIGSIIGFGIYKLFSKILKINNKEYLIE